MTSPPTGQDHVPLLGTAWTERPPLVSPMFNPALIASLLAAAVESYTKENRTGMPWALSFLTAPLVLHRGTRQALPASSRTHLSTWVSAHPVLRAGFPARAQTLVGPVRAGLRFSLRHQVLKLEEDLLYTQLRLLKAPPGHQELANVLNRSRRVGRWLATVDTATAFAHLGVAP